MEDGTTERRCRFVRRLDGDRLTKLDIPKCWFEILGGEPIEKLWAEAGVRVTPDNVPLDASPPYLRPIAAVSASRLFVVAEIMAEDVPSCALLTAFKGKVFDVSKCQDAEVCLTRALKAYMDGLARTLAGEPFLAEKDRSGEAPPGELWFRRENQPSRVLKSAYYERTMYLVKWWGAGDGSFPPEVAMTAKGATDGDVLFVSIHPELNIAVGPKDAYYYPTEEQKQRYKTRVAQAATVTLKEVCSRLRGIYKNDFCSLSK
jgi:hypothetical protein